MDRIAVISPSPSKSIRLCRQMARCLAGMGYFPLLEIPEETNGQPFQKYGTLILKYLEEFQPERYQQLLVNGTLMEKIREREAEIIDMEMTVLETL